MLKKIFIVVLAFVTTIVLVSCNSSTSITNQVGASGINGIKKVKTSTEYSIDTTIDQMETVTFGTYPQSDISGNKKDAIEWIVLDRQDNKALLYSKYILDCKCYNNLLKDVSWETCDIRKWLNDSFYNSAFDSSEKSQIVNTNVDSVTNDKVFLLSEEEVRKYFGNGIKSEYGYQLGKNISTKGTDYAKNVENLDSELSSYDNKLWVYNHSVESAGEHVKWADGNSVYWIRSTGTPKNYTSRVNSSSYLYIDDFVVNSPLLGVRPAIWVTY